MNPQQAPITRSRDKHRALHSEHQNRVSIRCIASVQINSSDLSIDRFAETSNCDPLNDGRRIAPVRRYCSPADARCCEGNGTKK